MEPSTLLLTSRSGMPLHRSPHAFSRPEIVSNSTLWMGGASVGVRVRVGARVRVGVGVGVRVRVRVRVRVWVTVP